MRRQTGRWGSGVGIEGRVHSEGRKREERALGREKKHEGEREKKHKKQRHRDYEDSKKNRDQY